MSEPQHPSSSVPGYLVIALLLAAFTIAEILVATNHLSWLNASGNTTLLVILTAINFGLSVLFFMHLRSDNRAVSGVFIIGFALAVGTFIILAHIFAASDSIQRGQLVTVQPPPQAVSLPNPSPSQALQHPSPQDLSQNFAPPNLASESGIAQTPVAQSNPQAVNKPVSLKSGALAANGGAGGPSAQAAASGGQAAGFDWQKIGASTYSTCAACHQANGKGVPGAFPPLAGSLPDIYNTKGGPTVLIHTVLFGLQGKISVEGKSYNSTMPAHKQLSDAQIAAVLDHELTSWGNAKKVKNFKPIQPSEVKAQRSKDLTPQQVYQERQKLKLK